MELKNNTLPPNPYPFLSHLNQSTNRTQCLWWWVSVLMLNSKWWQGIICKTSLHLYSQSPEWSMRKPLWMLGRTLFKCSQTKSKSISSTNNTIIISIWKIKGNSEILTDNKTKTEIISFLGSNIIKNSPFSKHLEIWELLKCPEFPCHICREKVSMSY